VQLRNNSSNAQIAGIQIAPVGQQAAQEQVAES
jgi:hypothetical protein